MSKFKAGDRVVELSTGDRGTVEGPTGDDTYVRGGVQITKLWVLWDAIDMTNAKGRDEMRAWIGEMRAWIGDDKICFESEFAAIELLTSRGYYTITRK